MDLMGIGVLLIGIALLVLAIYLARVLNNVASILNGVDKTIEQLPTQLDGILQETGNLIQNSNNTLADVNEKLGTLSPLFHIVGDVGESTRILSSSLVDLTASAKNKMSEADRDKQDKRLGGLYGTAALGFYTMRKTKMAKKRSGVILGKNLYSEGEKHTIAINKMKEEAKEAVSRGE
ncbi:MULTISPECIES: DUF948 domain-containing protein [Sporosarcina]|uniref:Uncharacterized protein YoxC n=1 Tax=Sporosarcina psychrophila TaxID=1476 RepID=A0ABV2KA70_SPOPS|nr:MULTISPECIES: DUF948 domain-containing protein [Sporosarcina]QNK89331.1 DUF948 domain-containing protein [Sporosarcina sp. resist]